MVRLSHVFVTAQYWSDPPRAGTRRHIKEVCICRHAYDAYQNVSCPAISQSKLTCNTNITAIMPGPAGQYAFKYHLKGTQKDDTGEYERVASATRKVLSSVRAHQSDGSEAVRRLLSASFAHQKTNVIGGAMASYLTRNKSRFVFSHKTVWCPLRDIKQLLKGKQVNASILHHANIPFLSVLRITLSLLAPGTGSRECIRFLLSI